jgi:hypothetical protein
VSNLKLLNTTCTASEIMKNAKNGTNFNRSSLQSLHDSQFEGCSCESLIFDYKISSPRSWPVMSNHNLSPENKCRKP